MVDLRENRALRRVTGRGSEGLMDAIRQYRRAARLAGRGLSEERIGVRMGIRQWTVSRLLALRTLDDDVARIFAGDGRITHAALREVASYPADVQSSALRDLWRLALSLAGRTVTRRDVAPVMALHGRDLDRDPFPTTSCRACLNRTGAQADLFGGVPEGLGRCLDAACFARCLNAVSARQKRWAGHKKEKQECTSK